MATATVIDTARRFLDALGRRDFEALAETFAADASLRGLVPSTLREEEGPHAIAARFAFWNDQEDWALVGSDVEELADIVRIRWRVEATDSEVGRAVVEQTAYARIEDDRIAWMNLVCSGHRATGA